MALIEGFERNRMLRQLSSFAGSVLFSALIVFLGWTVPEFSRPSLGYRLFVGD
jgi:hypothetical protein